MVIRYIASCMGIGYLKGGGTYAALLTATVWILLYKAGAGTMIAVTGTVAVTLLGAWTAQKMEIEWGKDSSKVVIDEVAGMCIALLFLPVSLVWTGAALVLFRFFDIVKPLYIRRMEAIPGGWGVMADDLLAGVYTNLLLQAAVHMI
jgi:phosphatidylglycerophosphatase A